MFAERGVLSKVIMSRGIQQGNYTADDIPPTAALFAP
jgi:hypothetical protein